VCPVGLHHSGHCPHFPLPQPILHDLIRPHAPEAPVQAQALHKTRAFERRGRLFIIKGMINQRADAWARQMGSARTFPTLSSFQGWRMGLCVHGELACVHVSSCMHTVPRASVAVPVYRCIYACVPMCAYTCMCMSVCAHSCV
jgi:hypothetical protein